MLNLEFLKSKKLIMGILGLISLTVVMIFVGLPVETYVSLFSSIIGVYMISQGIADTGKEKAKVDKED